MPDNAPTIESLARQYAQARMAVLTDSAPTPEMHALADRAEAALFAAVGVGQTHALRPTERSLAGSGGRVAAVGAQGLPAGLTEAAAGISR